MLLINIGKKIIKHKPDNRQGSTAARIWVQKQDLPTQLVEVVLRHMA